MDILELYLIDPSWKGELEFLGYEGSPQEIERRTNEKLFPNGKENFFDYLEREKIIEYVSRV